MRINFLPLLLLSGILALTSCEKGGVYDPETTKNLTDLTVPQDFDWSSSKDVAVAISSPVETIVTIFADEKCQHILAKVPASGKPAIYNLSLTANAKQVFVQYPIQEGGKAIQPYAVAQTRSSENCIIELPENTAKLPEDEGEYIEGSTWENCYIKYPQAEWGTLLFEDMWPELGDYDLNDLVAWYNIQLQGLKGEGEEQTVMAINMGIRLNALGGTFPYHLCLQIDNLESGFIDDTECRGKENIFSWKSEGEAGPAIFSFDWKDKKGKGGATYYNTEKDYLVDWETLEQDKLNVIIYLKAGVKVKDLKHTAFNFFLCKDDGTEIHLKGYKPTAAFEKRYQEIVEANDHLNKTVPYCTVDNFVWGIKVPKDIDHAAESVDFTKAYTSFTEWIQSSGSQPAEWYSPTYKVPQNCITVH